MINTHSGVVAASALVLAAGAAAAGPAFSLTAQVRDFRARNTPGGHPDFQWFVSGHSPGMINTTLPPDGRPVYVGSNDYGAVTSPETFDQWYRNVDDVNLPIPITLDFVPDGNNFVFQSNDFFPIDDQGYGNQGNAHNYHFTMAVRGEFQYDEGANQTFTYAGDDDLWAFVNDQLIIDLGGVHGSLSQTVNMDTLAPMIGLVDGEFYDLDIFFAERFLVNSTIRIETSFEVIPSPGTAAALGLVGFAAGGSRRRRG